jgi:pyruvate dehydrogenase E2 component (dihydrolipoamide acetyltransferase)
MDVLMPQLGETVAEGKITKWFVPAGTAVKPGDNLFEIETDKVSMEVPSTTTGVITEIRVSAGEVAPVGAVVAVIADGTGAPAGPRPAAAPAEPVLVAAPVLAAARAPIQRSEPMGPRIRGDERPSAKLDPFFEVRTPERNFGPARRRNGHRPFAVARFRPAWPHCRRRHRQHSARLARHARREPRRERREGALRAWQLRGSAA